MLALDCGEFNVEAAFGSLLAGFKV